MTNERKKEKIIETVKSIDEYNSGGIQLKTHWLPYREISQSVGPLSHFHYASNSMLLFEHSHSPSVFCVFQLDGSVCQRYQMLIPMGEWFDAACFALIRFSLVERCFDLRSVFWTHSNLLVDGRIAQVHPKVDRTLDRCSHFDCITSLACNDCSTDARSTHTEAIHWNRNGETIQAVKFRKQTRSNSIIDSSKSTNMRLSALIVPANGCIVRAQYWVEQKPKLGNDAIAHTKLSSNQIVSTQVGYCAALPSRRRGPIRISRSNRIASLTLSTVLNVVAAVPATPECGRNNFSNGNITAGRISGGTSEFNNLQANWPCVY